MSTSPSALVDLDLPLGSPFRAASDVQQDDRAVDQPWLGTALLLSGVLWSALGVVVHAIWF